MSKKATSDSVIPPCPCGARHEWRNSKKMYRLTCSRLGTAEVTPRCVGTRLRRAEGTAINDWVEKVKGAKPLNAEGLQAEPQFGDED